jgi:hypothetical protein
MEGNHCLYREIIANRKVSARHVWSEGRTRSCRLEDLHACLCITHTRQQIEGITGEIAIEFLRH